MVVDDKLILKQIWTCLFLPLMTVAWRPLILAYDLVFDTIETITACFETEGKWRIVFSNRFVLGETVLLYVKSFWTPKPLKCLSSIRAPVRCRFLCAAGGLSESVPCSSLVTNRRMSIHTLPMSIPVYTTATYSIWSMKNLNVVMLPVFPILSMQLVTSTSFFHFLIS